MNRHLRRLAAPVLLLLCGCGIDPQSAPEDLDLSPIPAVTPGPTVSTPGPGVELFLLRGGRLAPVNRSATFDAPATALRLLADGPTPEEAASGYTTAIAPQSLTVADIGDADARTLAVDVTPALTSVGGDDQLLAFAQVVWTVTGFDGVEQVVFTTDDQALEVPTDEGLSDQPVDRADYASLAPADAATGTTGP